MKKNVVVKVETLENLCNPELITDFAVASRQDSNQPVSESTVNNVVNKEKEPQLSSKYVEIRENQMGVSYKSLFGDYMRSAKKMTIIDPYIRATFQVDNLVDLVRTFVETTKETEGLEVELHTYETDEKLPALIDNLDQLQDDLERYGVEFTYSFDADHDRSISLDNGSEFSEFKLLEEHLSAEVYFAEPHKPWQRGTNENTNDIIRFFFPKGFDFRMVTDDDIQLVENIINNRPRKCLDWKTPAEVFYESVALA